MAVICKNSGRSRYRAGLKRVAVLVLCAMILNFSACTLWDGPSGRAEAVNATVTEIEKHGHAVLDITAAELVSKGYALGDVVRVRFGAYDADMPFFDGYYIPPGDVMLRGVTGEDSVAICINYGNFSDETGIAPGDSVEITLSQRGGMLALQELCSLEYSNNRDDYADDATFANFRAVTMGGIKEGRLYRTASPINNQNGRASYANALIEGAGVATVLNLADSMEDIEEYCEGEDFASEYYLELIESGRVKALDMNANFFSAEFASTLAEGFTFLANSEPPYCVHCTEGKDRAGFAVMLLTSLMGAELEEIIDDFMLSFYNYFGISKEAEPERYEVVLDTNLRAMLYHVTGTSSIEALVQADLSEAATAYLIGAGMAESDVVRLKQKLG